MKLVYLGSPEAAVLPLRALVEAGHEVMLVVSRADKRRGRGGALLPSAVKAEALELGLPVTDQPDEVLRAVEAGATLGVVVAYGRLIKPHLLAALPFVNLHFSLLPRWRGAAPVERAVLAGDRETGVCLMALEEGLDTGPVYRRAVVSIGAHEHAAALRKRLVAVGTDMLVEALRDGLGDAVVQEGEVTYAAKIDPSEYELVWERAAVDIERVVRLGSAWTTFRSKRLKVIDARAVEAHAVDAHTVDSVGLATGALDGVHVGTGNGMIELLVVQPEGRAPMAAPAWRNGARPARGELLG